MGGAGGGLVDRDHDGRNGTTFGIRLAGSDQWFTADAPEVGHALYYPGHGAADQRQGHRRQRRARAVGLGAAAAAGSPAVAQLLGGDLREAAGLTAQLAAVCAGRSSRFKLPALDNAGTPLGVDVRKVVELGITPEVTTGILHLLGGQRPDRRRRGRGAARLLRRRPADLDRRLSG